MRIDGAAFDHVGEAVAAARTDLATVAPDLAYGDRGERAEKMGMVTDARRSRFGDAHRMHQSDAPVRLSAGAVESLAIARAWGQAFDDGHLERLLELSAPQIRLAAHKRVEHRWTRRIPAGTLTCVAVADLLAAVAPADAGAHTDGIVDDDWTDSELAPCPPGYVCTTAVKP